MATSPLFGWEEPDDTDLVKDGAAAIRTLGNAIDTSMGDLLGGTTGQVLSKASNTNMDFTWITSDDANAIQNAIVDAKGDLITATAADTPARLAVGTNGQVLTADSTAATGLAWATASSGGMTLLSTTSISGASTTVSSISGSYKHLWINISGLTANTGSSNAISLEFNAVGADGFVTTQISNNVVGSNSNNASWQIGEQASGATSYFNGFVYDYSSTNLTSVEGMWGGFNQFTYNRFTSGFFNRNAAITSIKILANNTTMTAGSLKIYGVN